MPQQSTPRGTRSTDGKSPPRRAGGGTHAQSLNTNSTSNASKGAELSQEEDAFGLMEYIGAENAGATQQQQQQPSPATTEPPLARMVSPASFRTEHRGGLGLNRVTAVYDESWGDTVGGGYDSSSNRRGFGMPSSSVGGPHCSCGAQVGATRLLAAIQSHAKAAIDALAEELEVALDWTPDVALSTSPPRSASPAGPVATSMSPGASSDHGSGTSASGASGSPAALPVDVPLPQRLAKCLEPFVLALIPGPPCPPSQADMGSSARLRQQMAETDAASLCSVVRPQPPRPNSSASPPTSSRPRLASFGRRHSTTATEPPPTSSLSGATVNHLLATAPSSGPGGRAVDVSLVAERTLPPAFGDDELNGTRSDSVTLENDLPTPVAQWFGDPPLLRPGVEGGDDSGSTGNDTPKGQSTRTLPPMPMPPRGTVCAQVVRSYSEAVDAARAKTVAAVTPLVRLLAAIAAGTLAPPPPPPPPPVSNAATADRSASSASCNNLRPRASSGVDFNVSTFSALAAAAAADRRRSSAFTTSRVPFQHHHRASVQAAGIPQAAASNRPLIGEPPSLPTVQSSPGQAHLAVNATPLFSLMASPIYDAGGSGGLGSGSRRKTQARVEAAMIMSLREAPAYTALPPTGEPAVEFNSSVASLTHLPATGHTTSATIGESHDAAGLMADDGGAFTVNQYLLLCELGAGKQGRVFLAEDTQSGMARAVKVIPRPGGHRQRAAIEQALSQSNSGPPSMTASPSNAGSALAVARAMRHRGLQREVSVMKKCRHKNIVALYEVIDDPTDDRMYLVMQYVEQGPLASLSPDGSVSRTFGAADLAGIARQLCAGLEYLHRKGVAHRDIKPDNILRDRDGTVYLSDFGMAELLESETANPTSQQTTGRQGIHGTRGTIAFMAPELFDASATEQVSGEAVDVWALGISFYALLFGRVPWERPGGDDGSSATASSQQRTRSITDQICAYNAADRIPAELGGADEDGNVTVDGSAVVPAADLPPALYPHWRSLLVAMLTLDPAARISAQEVRKLVLELDSLSATLTPEGSTVVAPKDHDAASPVEEAVTRRW